MAQRTVRLVRSHTHAGQSLRPGAQLILDERRAAWLIDQGVAVSAADWTPERAALLTPRDAMQAKTKTALPKAAPARMGCCGQRAR